jgi:transposase-like protein
MKQTPVKPYSIDDLCELYGVTRKVFFSWRKLFIKKLGKLQARMYTPAQVKIIFEHVGFPKDEE